MAETDVASAITPSMSTAVTAAIKTAAEIDSAGQIFNPLFGTYVSDPYVLYGNPVAASVVRWTQVTPNGTTATVETSINNGASWDVATNNRPVPRLREGDTTTRTVLSRVTLTRTSSGVTPPQVWLEVRIACRISTDELIPTFFGAVDTTKTKITGGSSGGSSSSGSSAVTARGGGQVGGGASVNVHAVDPSRLIKLAEWPQPYFDAANLNYAAALKAMVLDRHPRQTLFSQVSTTRTLPSIAVFGTDDGNDPWQDIEGVATAIGHECFFGPAGGMFVSRPVPDPRIGVPVWEFNQSANPTIVESEQQQSDNLIVNGYVITGASTTSANPVSAYAYNTDPASHTNIARIGPRIKRLTFPLAITADQCQAIANALLLNSMGLATTVTVSVIPHPGLEPGDIVRCTAPENDIAGTFMVQSFTLPDSPAEAMQLVLFRQTDNPDA